MIGSDALPLNTIHAIRLAEWQREVDEIPDFADRVQTGKSRFKSLNVENNLTFWHIRDVLSSMCRGARRCCYCEDSSAIDIEHIWPKNFYPSAVLSWNNYLYACGRCNRKKNAKFAILEDNPPRLTSLCRRKNAPIVRPPEGRPAFINPRIEDPLEYYWLDILDTFRLTITSPRPSEAWTRADYTIDVLQLNEKEDLVQGRREAYSSYRDRLATYITRKHTAPADELERRQKEIRGAGHRTVWCEMKRSHAQIPLLQELFAAAPEALGW